MCPLGVWVGCAEYAGGGSSVEILGVGRVASEEGCWVCGEALLVLFLTTVVVEADSDGVTDSVIVPFGFVSCEALSRKEKLCAVLVASML